MVAVTVLPLRPGGGGGATDPLGLEGGGGGGAFVGALSSSSSGIFPFMRYLLRTGSHLISSSGGSCSGVGFSEVPLVFYYLTNWLAVFLNVSTALFQ